MGFKAVLLVAVLVAPLGLAEPPCKRPTSLTFRGDGHGFQRKRNRFLVSKSGSARHRGQDRVAVTGTPQRLVAKCAYGKLDKDLERESVTFYTRSSKCAGWTHLGGAITSESGEYGTKWGVEDDGGRVYFQLGRPLPTGQHRVTMVVDADHTTASWDLWVVQKGTAAVVFDIDGTLTTGDGEITTQVIKRQGGGDYMPKMRPAATVVANAWAAKGYLIIYVTGRPDNLQHISRRWLVQHGFPPGPIRLADTLKQVRPSSSGVGAFKTRVLSGLLGQGVDIQQVYGNAATDIEAYEAIRIPKNRTWIIGENAGESQTQALTSYGDHYNKIVKGAKAATIKAPRGIW